MRIPLLILAMMLASSVASAQPPPELVWEATPPVGSFVMGPNTAIALSPDGAYVGIGWSDGFDYDALGYIEVRDTDTGTVVQHMETVGSEPLAAIRFVTFRPGAPRLVTSSWSSECGPSFCGTRNLGMQEWSLTDGELVRHEPWPEGLVGSFDASGSRFAAYLSQGYASDPPFSVIDWATLDSVWTRTAYSERLLDLTFNGEDVLTYGYDQLPAEQGSVRHVFLQEWAAATGAPGPRFEHTEPCSDSPSGNGWCGQDGDLGAMARSPNGALFATSSGYGASRSGIDIPGTAYTKLWDAATGALLYRIPAFYYENIAGFRSYLAFTPNSRYLLVATGWSSPNGRRSHVVFVDVETGEEAAAFTLDGQVHWVGIPGGTGGAFMTYLSQSGGPPTLSLYQSGLVTGTMSETPESPSLALPTPVPNPAREMTTVTLVVVELGPVRAGLYDLLGREVRALFEGQAGVGELPLQIDVRTLPSGTYVLQVVDGEGRAVSQKLSVIH